MNEHLLYCKSCKKWTNPKQSDDVRYYCTVVNSGMYSVDQVYHEPKQLGYYSARCITRKTGESGGKPIYRMEARLGQYLGKDVSMGQDTTPLTAE